MMEGELEVALVKVDINRHEAVDMLGSLGKLMLLDCVDGITHSLTDIRCSFFFSAESRM